MAPLSPGGIRGALSVLLHVVSELMKSWAKQDLVHPLRPVILPADVRDTVFLYASVCFRSCLGVSVQGALGDVNAIYHES